MIYRFALASPLARGLAACRTIALGLILTPAAFAASDYQWTFNESSMVDYRLDAVSSTLLYDGSLPALDPTINLIVGKRYGVTVPVFAIHPFQLIAKGASAAQDVVLLAQGATGGSFEADAGVGWTDSGQTVEFTLTPTLAAAMAPDANRAPGYRCAIHSDAMRGNFVIYGLGSAIADPIPGPIPRGPFVVEVETVIDSLVAPLGLTQPGDGTGRLFVHDQAGVVRIIANGSPLATPFLDVTSRLVTLNAGYDERGLLGFAMHPDFASNGKVYTYTSEPVAGAADFTTTLNSGSFNHQSVIAEWTVSGGNPNAIDTATRRELLRVDQPQSNHNGGAMHFGPDGMLYIALGDGGAADDDGDGHGEGNGQNSDNIYGSLIRIDPDGSNAANGQYGVPADNPFVGTAGLDEIFAYGFRNPFSFHFDPVGGALYLGDVGQNDVEEVDLVNAGGNYGWNVKEGSFYFDPNGAGAGFATDAPARPVPTGLVDPIAQYDHDEGIAVIGGCVYRGSGLAGFDGTYIFGELTAPSGGAAGRLLYLAADNELRELQLGLGDRALGKYVKGFGQDAAGEVYVAVSDNIGPGGTTGSVLRLLPVQVPVELSDFTVN